MSNKTSQLNCPEKLSPFLLQLYQGVHTRSLSSFKDWSLNLLKSYMPFDMALWAGGRAKEAAVENIHHCHLYNLPADFLKTWDTHKEQDQLAFRILSKPGQAFTEADLGAERKKTALYREHSSPFQIERAVSMALVQKITGLFCVISLYRKNQQQPFDGDNCTAFRLIMPHLLEAATMNQLYHCGNDRGSLLDMRTSAICDNRGLLHMAQNDFGKMLQREWPTWRGSSLPDAVINILPQKNKHFVGKQIVITQEKTSDLHLLHIRQTGPLERLSKREAEIALLLAKGETYKNIATLLFISHSTVNKHALSIYKKMKVVNKAELAGKVFPQ